MTVSSRFISDVEKQLQRRKHVVLYGNIYDQFLWRGSYVSVDQFLAQSFQEMRFEIVAGFDPLDGFRFADAQPSPLYPAPVGSAAAQRQEKMAARFEALVREATAARLPGAPAAPAIGDGSGAIPSTSPPPPLPAPASAAAGGLTTPPARAVPGAASAMNAAAGAVNRLVGSMRRISPEEAFGGLRAALSQPETSVAASINLGDMLTGDASRYDGGERAVLMLLMKCLLEAAVITRGPLRGYRNTVVLKASDLARVPEWLYRDNPYVAIVQATRPNKDERRQYALSFLRPGEQSGGFYGGADLDDAPPSMETVADEFADLTDGLQAMDLEALRVTSWTNRIAVRPREQWRLVDFYKFGVRDDPWEKLSPDKVRSATEALSRRVIGQPRAVDAVTSMLTSARVGLSMTGSGGRSTKPRGIFFFVGPTGVGKTELAKAMTQLVFGDERAFARFDMSEYKEEHAAEKLAGAPPGFVGYEEGGQLTNRVIEQPHSILLFDEIEKAHPKVLDKFLQILEDGRLTDGKGQTAYFNQTAIIFTSNIGASDLTDAQSGAMIRPGIMSRVRGASADDFPYPMIAQHFRTEVDWYFTSRIGRAELLNRLGDNIVAFDMLRPDFVAAIAGKFLAALADASREKYRLTLVFDVSVLAGILERMKEGDNLLFGGRRIKSLLETLIERPLNRWLFENRPEPGELAGRILRVGLAGQALDVRDEGDVAEPTGRGAADGAQVPATVSGAAVAAGLGLGAGAGAP